MRISRAVCRTTGDLDIHLVAGDQEAAPDTVFTAAFDALEGRATVRLGSQLSVGDEAGCLIVREVSAFEERPAVELDVATFELDTSVDLTEDADRFGLATASDDSRGHFDRLALQPLAVSSVRQAATAAFTEEGFRAAAATAVLMLAGGMPPLTALRIDVLHDRPFGFLAVDRTSGLVVFTGWVAEPQPYVHPNPIVL